MPPVELAVRHVERDHVRGAALEQAVGEAAGRGADVEAVAARRVDPSESSAFASLTPPARDVLLPRLDDHGNVAGTIWPGFAARAPSSPPSRTLPAITAAAARERDSNRPRSASRESSLVFAMRGRVPGGGFRPTGGGVSATATRLCPRAHTNWAT